MGVYLPVEPLNPPPVYAPELVAGAILHCAEYSERDVYVGAGGKAISLAGKFAPRLTDKMMEATLFDLQKSDEPSPPSRPDSLFSPMSKLEERGGYPGHVAESSLYTKASLNSLIAGLLIAGAGFGLAALLRQSGRNGNAETDAIWKLTSMQRH